MAFGTSTIFPSNIGDTADPGDDSHSGAEIAAMMAEPNFDFTRQVVLSRSQPAACCRTRYALSLIRAVCTFPATATAARSWRSRYILALPARAHERVRLVRANLMMTGMIFSRMSIPTSCSTTIFSPDVARPSYRHEELDLRINCQSRVTATAALDWKSDCTLTAPQPVK